MCGRGLAVICTRVCGSVFFARVLARNAISDERAYARREPEARLNGAGLVNAGLARDDISTISIPHLGSFV